MKDRLVCGTLVITVRVFPWLQKISILKQSAQYSIMEWMKEKERTERYHFRCNFEITIQVSRKHYYLLGLVLIYGASGKRYPSVPQ